MGFILAFTNSANRTVINSTVASPLQLGRGQLQAEASAHTPSPRRGFCSFILAADPSGTVQSLCVTHPHCLPSLTWRSAGAVRNIRRGKVQKRDGVTDFLALFWQQQDNQTKGRGHEKDSCNSGPDLRTHRRHGTDNGLWIWSCPNRFDLLTIASLVFVSYCQGEAPGTLPNSSSSWGLSSFIHHVLAH